MPKNFKAPALPANWASMPSNWRDPRFLVRASLGVMLFANFVALYFLFFPLGGSPEELNSQLNSLRSQILQRRAALERAKLIGTKVEKGRGDGDQFLRDYFLSSRNAYSTIVGELVEAGKKANVRLKEHSYVSEPIDGSEDLSMLSITANYEGKYPDLLRFINEIDHSKRLLIIENLQAQPQQNSGGMLNVSIRFDTFVREEPFASGPAPEVASR